MLAPLPRYSAPPGAIDTALLWPQPIDIAHLGGAAGGEESGCLVGNQLGKMADNWERWRNVDESRTRMNLAPDLGERQNDTAPSASSFRTIEDQPA